MLSIGDDAEVIIRALEERGMVMAGVPEGIKIKALSTQTFEAVSSFADVVLVEADGSRMRPLKYPRESEPVIPENTDESDHIPVIGDAQVAPDLILLDIRRIDGNDHFRMILELQQHAHLGIGRKAGQNTGSVKIIKQLTAKLQIQLTTKIVDALTDLFGLYAQIFIVIKTNSIHDYAFPNSK